MREPCQKCANTAWRLVCCEDHFIGCFLFYSVILYIVSLNKTAPIWGCRIGISDGPPGLGRMTGVEPATTASTVRRSAIELHPPYSAQAVFGAYSITKTGCQQASAAGLAPLLLWGLNTARGFANP